MVIDWLIHVAGLASYQNVFSEPFRFGSCHSNDEMMGGKRGRVQTWYGSSTEWLVNWVALSAILWNCISSNHPASLIGCKLFLAKDHDSLLGEEEDGWNYIGWVASSFLVPVGLSIAMNPPALLIFFARCPVRCQESGGGKQSTLPLFVYFVYLYFCPEQP